MSSSRFYNHSINKCNFPEHCNVPRELQYEGVPVDEADLEAGENQPRNVMTSSQYNDTYVYGFHVDL